MSFSMFKPIKNPFDHFNFDYIDCLFVENRLLDWIGEKDQDGKEMKSLGDFFQPGYLEAQKQTFFWGLDTIPDEINFSWINHLHYLGSNNLFHEEAGSPIPHHVRKAMTHLDFPNILTQVFYAAGNKASPAGIESLSKEISDVHDEETKGKVIFCIRDISLENEEPITGQVIDAQVAKRYYEEQQKLFENNEVFFNELIQQTNISPAKLFASRITSKEDKVALMIAMGEIVKAGYSPLLKLVGYCLLNESPFQIRAKAEKMITNYNQASKANENEILDAIITLVKGLLNLHVWPDGNGRLCAHHLLNLLLIKNGLTPTLLKNNCLDAFSPEELRERVKEGMKLFAAKRNKDSTLDKFRKDNELSVAKESNFSTAILNNKIDVAKEYLRDKIDLTKNDLSFFSSCSLAHMDWFAPYFSTNQLLDIDNISYTEGELIEKLIPLALQNANGGLLHSLIESCIENEILLSETNIRNMLINGDFKTYQLLDSMLNNTKITVKEVIFFQVLPYCRNEKVSLAIVDYISKNIENDDLNFDVAFKVFRLQKPSVILKYIEHAKNHLSTYSDASPFIKNLIHSIENRINLTADEKNMILQKINPALKFVAPDPLADFSISHHHNYS